MSLYPGGLLYPSPGLHPSLPPFPWLAYEWPTVSLPTDADIEGYQSLAVIAASESTVAITAHASTVAITAPSTGVQIVPGDTDATVDPAPTTVEIDYA